MEREEKEEDDEIYCGPDGDIEKYEDNDDVDCRNYVVRRLMLTPKQEDKTQRH